MSSAYAAEQADDAGHSDQPLLLRNRSLGLLPLRTRLAVRAGTAAAVLSQRAGLGAGAVIGGRITLAIDPASLARLAAGRRVVLVSGTNGKTTTSHLLAAALRLSGPVVHNGSGANMIDGAVAALAADRTAPLAVLEVDELHLAQVAAAVQPDVVVLLNFSRDQLDRGNEVRAVAAAVHSALTECPLTTVVANADDPMVVWAAESSARPVWVAAGGLWMGDAEMCPRCGRPLITGRSGGDDGQAQPAAQARWHCRCGLHRPVPTWQVLENAASTPEGPVPVRLRLPGAINTSNAVMAMAASALLGIDPARAADAMAEVEAVAGRYAVVRRGRQTLRLLLAKNPAGFAEALQLLTPGRPLLSVINAQPADGLDTSWLWDVRFSSLTGPVVASGERAADLGVRLSYAGIAHSTAMDPLDGLDQLPDGAVDVLANYTAFHRLRQRLGIQDAR